MKTALVLPCKNQEKEILFHLRLLKKAKEKPDYVIIVDDHSDNPLPMRSSEDGWVIVVPGDKRGRSTTRNRGIEEALSTDADLVVFMDGDSVIEDELFFSRLKTYIEDAQKPKLVFGTRIHAEKPYDLDKWYDGENVFYKKYPNMPSDLLTANMDNFQDGLPLDHRDLREVANVVEGFSSCEDFEEKVDYMLTGMVSWSCSFAITRPALELVKGFMKEVYGLDNMIFDEVDFREQWGYEDVAFGLDALYAGVEVDIQDQSRIIHFMHGRSDQLFTHVKGKHLIMQRYRRILSLKGRGNGTSGYPPNIELGDSTILIKGRSFERKGGLAGTLVVQEDGTIRSEGFIYNYKENTFKKSIWSTIMLKMIKLFPKRK